MRTLTTRVLIAGTATLFVGGATALPSLADLVKPEPKMIQVAGAADPIPGKYIVTLKNGASASAEAGEVKAKPTEQYQGALNGFAAKLSDDQLKKLRSDPDVAAIEHDQTVKLSTTQTGKLSWGQDRIDQRKRPLSKSYTYKATASNVHAYVMDSGINATHKEFGGRANSVYDAYNQGGADCNGHGTHVAGIIGSQTWGVAKKVKLHAVRVFDCDGSAETSKIIAAVNWLKGHAAKPAVANMSFGGDKSAALDTAVANLSKSGVFVAVASGNGNGEDVGYNACNYSPSGAAWVMTVGASTVYDNRTRWSNYGKCVDIHAPGDGIWSTWIGSTTATNVESGTSMATPYVSGVAALYLSSHTKATFPTVQKWLNDNSTKNVLGRMPSGTANRLLYKAGL